MSEEKDKSFLIKFGENLKKLKKEKKGLSYRKIAQNCSLDYSDIKKFELGKTNITLLTLEELAKGYGVEAWELLKFE